MFLERGELGGDGQILLLLRGKRLADLDLGLEVYTRLVERRARESRYTYLLEASGIPPSALAIAPARLLDLPLWK